MKTLSEAEKKLLLSLDSASKIQDYLDSISFNFEEQGETCMSPQRVLKEKKAHCLEGALLACAALWLQGKSPRIMNLKVKDKDYDHVVTLFKEKGYWGAISKTNHAVLRFRDPVYKTVRELAMSYFHEYFLVKNGEKTLLGYSRPISIKRFGTKWITEEQDLWDIATTIFDLPHTRTIPEGQEKFIRKASILEQHSASIPAYTKHT
jgi:hypothetical protein